MPMAHLPWLIRAFFFFFFFFFFFSLVFEYPGNSSDSSRKQIFRDILGTLSYFILKIASSRRF